MLPSKALDLEVVQRELHDTVVAKLLALPRVGDRRHVCFELESLDLNGVAVTIEDATPAHGMRDPSYCALVYERRETNDETTREEWLRTVHARSILPVVYGVLNRRERRFASFAPSISLKYWMDAGKQLCSRADANRLSPPWEDTEQGRRTVSLSCDLRRSTFCMSQSDSMGFYARWLDELVQVLTRATHEYGGVFEKCTGDGCLVHFVVREVNEVYGSDEEKGPSSVVLSAIACSLQMHRCISMHMDRLKPNLRLYADGLGAGMAIACSDGFWARDYHDNPIVVGQGVVEACRLCDSARAGELLLTNNAYFAVNDADRRTLLSSVESTAIETKEYGRRMEVRAMRFAFEELERSCGTPTCRRKAREMYESVIPQARES